MKRKKKTIEDNKARERERNVSRLRDVADKIKRREDNKKHNENQMKDSKIENE